MLASDGMVMAEEKKTRDRNPFSATNNTTTTITETLVERGSRRKEPGESCLVLLMGPDIGKRFPLGEGKHLVGRDSEALISLREASVSRHHAEVVVDDSQVVVRDMGSTNGTYVNDGLVTSSTVSDGDIVKFGRVIFKFLCGSNIENAYHQEIYRLTTTDPMTQLFNRRYLMETLVREISRARRYHHELSFAMVDLDHFKHVNDTYGHLAGDHVLKMVGRSLQRSLRRPDILARYGGEEFGVIFPETGLEAVIEVSERLRESVAKRAYTFDGFPIPITISMGVAALSPDDSADGIDLIQRADERLMAAKSGGRNKVVGS
tara:strand:+ start:452 stop:1408 length:957 start_codon:yes stop_codon:yes gene_type:complete